MKKTNPATILAIALLATACSGDGASYSPTAPTPLAPSPPPPPLSAPYPWWPPGTQTWGNTWRIVEVSGPNECYVRDTKLRVGQTIGPAPLGIVRSGGDLQIFWDDGLSDWMYLGTVQGDRFSASASIGGWGWGCIGGASDVLVRIDFQLSGHFSADNRQLTATHIATYHFRSGVMTVVEEWAASRID